MDFLIILRISKNTFLIPKFGESFKNTGTYTLKLNNVEWSDVEVKDLINFGEFCKTTTLFKTTGKISNFINGSIKIKTCTEAEAWQFYDLFGIECFQPNADLHIYSNTEQIFLIGPSKIAEGSDHIKFEPLVLSANRKSIEYYVMYTKSGTTSSGMINLADINTVDSRLSAEIVGDYEVLEISAFENGSENQKFTIYANHGSITSSIGMTLTKRIYSGTFVIATEDGLTFVADGAQAIVLSGLDKLHKLRVVEPEGDGKYIYSAVIWGANGAALTYFGNLAFKETALTTLFIPSGSNLSIGHGIVAGCSKLESFIGSHISEDGNILYKDDFIKGVIRNAFDNDSKLVVDPTWISKTNGGIDGYVFYNNNLLNVLDFSNCSYNMYFNTHSFDGNNISEIILVENISIHLKDYSLANTSKMKKLTDFKLEVNSDTKHAFYNSSIEEIEITKSGAISPKIDESMFEGCKYLKTISYPNSIISLGKTHLKDVLV